MRLGDVTRPGRDDGEIPAEVERELEALDAAIRGDEVPAGMEGLEALVSDLRAERELPEPRFEAELDAWAAAGFPRGERPGARAVGGGTGGKSGGFFSRFNPNGPRGWSPLAATTATLVVVCVSIAQIDFGDEGGPSTVAVQDADSGADVATESEAVTEPAAPEAANSAQQDDSLANGLDSALEDQGGSADAAGGIRALPREFSDERAAAGESASFQSKRGLTDVSRDPDDRKVERDAELTLAAPADEVPDVTNQVIDVVEDANGVVLNSRVTGTDDQARADLELKVPAKDLDDTLASMSDLADVKSRTEATEDITRSFVSAKDRLIGLKAERDNLATRIREATTDAEVDQLQAQLEVVNRQIADAESELTEVQNRAQVADLQVVITSDGARASDDDDGWSFGDALKDAGRVLEVGAGVALISAAVLVPLAIIAAIAFVVVAAMNRRARERALDE
jgi:hypothetical protein